MKRKSITVYTVLISIIFLFCIIFFGYNIFYEYNHGEIRCKKTSEFVIKTIKLNEENTNFNRLFEEKNDYEAILVKKDGKVIFSYPEASISNINETRMVKVYDQKFKTENSEYQVKLALYILRPSVIFYYAKFTFIAILVATIFAFILILYYQLSSKKEEREEDFKLIEEKKYEDESQSPSEIKDQSSDLHLFSDSKEKEDNTFDSEALKNESEKISKETDKSEAPEIKENPENTSENKKPSESSTNEEDSQSSFKESGNSEENYQVPSTPLSAFDSISEETPNEAADLFSSKTGFSNRNQLESRLESEIVRSASEEQDVSLIIARIQGLDYTSEAGKKISSLILSEVPFRNLVFNFFDDGFALIKKNTSIEEAENYSQSLLSKILLVLKEGQLEELKCGIGISSRSIRIVSEGRMIKEAEEALKHSFDDGESQITAFHVDIEKYREFLRNQD